MPLAENVRSLWWTMVEVHSRWNILRWFCCPWFGDSDVSYASLRAFCREVVPTKPFTNTALFYKMMLESEPTPLAPKCLGDFYGGPKANVGHSNPRD